MRVGDEVSHAVGEVTRGSSTKLECHLEQGRLNECYEKVRIGFEYCDGPCPLFRLHIW